MISLLQWWLWSTAAAVIWLLGATALSPTPDRIDCEEAHKKCTFREDCRNSLFTYMVDCAEVLRGSTTQCPYACRRTLISLMSHTAGLELAMCECHGEPFCETQKERLEVCRPEVSYATADKTVVSCSTAELICSSDIHCSTALSYYHRLCKAMFHGHKCSRRCNNSLNILGRQEKAQKLHDCYCDGSEDFPCIKIKENTQRLCFGRETYVEKKFTPKSGGRTFKSSWCVTSFLSCIVILWTFINNQLSIPNRFWVKSTWPWWWTSGFPKI